MLVSRFKGRTRRPILTMAGLGVLSAVALWPTHAAWAQDDDLMTTPGSQPPAVPQLTPQRQQPLAINPSPNLAPSQLSTPGDTLVTPTINPLGQPIGTWSSLGGQSSLGSAAAIQTVPSCTKNSPFDTTDVSDITTIVVNAGYSNVRGLYEGCDNLWRGHAMMNGMDVSIMVTPTGSVIPNGY